MRKLIVQEFVTINGFASDEEGKLDFFGSLTREVDRDQFKFIETLDTILMGANTYRMFVEYWPSATTDEEIVADKLNTTPKVVFSKSIDKAPWGKWEDAKVEGDAAIALTKMKREPGRDMVIWGSLSLVRSLMKEDIVDEYQLYVCPTILGKGKALFSEDSSNRALQLLETKTYDDGTVFLRYRTMK